MTDIKTEVKKQQRQRKRKSLFAPFPSKASKYAKTDKDIFTAEEIRARKTRQEDGKRQEKKSSRTGSRILYLVKWQGQDEKDNSWEPSSNILDKSLIRDFEERNKKLNWKWEYYAPSIQDGKPAGWLKFEDGNNDEINAAYEKWLDGTRKESSVQIQVLANQYTYDIDFETMTQKNMTRKEHTTRPIRRI